MLWDIKKDALKLHLRKLLCSFPQYPVNWLNSAMVLLLSLVPTKFSARWILCGSDSMLLLHSLMILGLNFSRVWFTEGLGLSSCWHSRNLFEMASCCLPLIFPSPPSSPKEHRLAWFAGCLQLRLLRDGVTVTLLDSWLAVSLQSTSSQTSPSLVPSAPSSSAFYIPLYFCQLSTNRLSYQLLFVFFWLLPTITNMWVHPVPPNPFWSQSPLPQLYPDTPFLLIHPTLLPSFLCLENRQTKQN